MSDNQIAEGVYGYDVGQVPPQPVLITTPDKGRVGDLKPALKELVLDTPGNQAYRVNEDSQAIGIQYLELDGTGGKEYTMPAERIATPAAQIDVDGDTVAPHEYTMYLAVRDLLATVARSDQEVLSSVVDLLDEADLPESVVDRATDDVSELTL